MRTNTQTKRELDKIDRNILRIYKPTGAFRSRSWGKRSDCRPPPAPSACAALSVKGSSWATTHASTPSI